MESLDYWRLCDHLNIVQAALLVAGCDPSSDASYVEGWTPENRPAGYEAAKTAISNALKRGVIEGEWVKEIEYDRDGSFFGWKEGTMNLTESLIEVHSLRNWLSARGFKTGFFFPEEGTAPDYLNSQHPRYAPKLAAAVRAWLAVQGDAPAGKSPKQTLLKWLRQNAAEFGLSDDDGKPNETGIEEAAKVANWQPGGGAPKTPGG